MSNYKYPKDLKEDIQPYFLFSSYDWTTKGKKNQDPVTNKTPVDSIVLPLASNGLNETITNNWQEASMIGSTGYLKALGQTLLTKAADSFGDIGKYITNRQGFIVNDYASLAYNGTNFRTFDFSFSMSPKNADESTMIENIIKSFKRNSLPSYQGWKILYPRFWNIRIVFPNSREIVKIKNCVLDNININNFPDNTFALLKDGLPVKREINVSFRELYKIDRNEYTE